MLASSFGAVVVRCDGRGSGFQGTNLLHRIQKRPGVFEEQDQKDALRYGGRKATRRKRRGASAPDRSARVHVCCSFLLREPYVDKSRVGAFGKVRAGATSPPPSAARGRRGSQRFWSGLRSTAATSPACWSAAKTLRSSAAPCCPPSPTLSCTVSFPMCDLRAQADRFCFGLRSRRRLQLRARRGRSRKTQPPPPPTIRAVAPGSSAGRST